MKGSLKKLSYISIIIPVYNGAEFLGRCLEAIRRSEYRSFEVIVVDDRSTDGSSKIARDLGATVLSMPKNSGPAAARNFAAQNATGEILLFIDADVVIRNDTIGKIAKRLTGEPNLAAVFGSYDDEPAEQNFLSQYKNLQHHYVHQNSNSEASTFWSGLGAMRKEIFLSHGGFDCDRFSVPSIEDIELGVRVIRSGHRIALDREIQAKHLKRWDFIPLLKTEIFCRALPWSQLIIERQGLINDMNLRSSDRASAVFLFLSLVMGFAAFWLPPLGLISLGMLVVIAVLNREFFGFLALKKGAAFTFVSFFWHMLYLAYCSAAFAYSLLAYRIRRILGESYPNAEDSAR